MGSGGFLCSIPIKTMNWQSAIYVRSLVHECIIFDVIVWRTEATQARAGRVACSRAQHSIDCVLCVKANLYLLNLDLFFFSNKTNLFPIRDYLQIIIR